MKKILLVGILLMVAVLGQAAFAVTPALIGGVRDGLAIGIMADAQTKNSNLGIRYGFEANTGGNPIILFFGGKFFLTNIEAKTPLSLGLGLIGYLGASSSGDYKDSNLGISVSAIFDRPFGIEPMFIETGIDIAGTGRLQLQAGYRY